MAAIALTDAQLEQIRTTAAQLPRKLHERLMFSLTFDPARGYVTARATAS